MYVSIFMCLLSPPAGHSAAGCGGHEQVHGREGRERLHLPPELPGHHHARQDHLHQGQQQGGNTVVCNHTLCISTHSM